MGYKQVVRLVRNGDKYIIRLISPTANLIELSMDQELD